MSGTAKKGDSQGPKKTFALIPVSDIELNFDYLNRSINYRVDPSFTYLIYNTEGNPPESKCELCAITTAGQHARHFQEKAIFFGRLQRTNVCSRLITIPGMPRSAV